MIMVGGRTRSAGVPSHWPSPGIPGVLGECMAGPVSWARAATGAAARSSAAAIDHGLVPGSARRLDMRS